MGTLEPLAALVAANVNLRDQYRRIQAALEEQEPGIIGSATVDGLSKDLFTEIDTLPDKIKRNELDIAEKLDAYAFVVKKLEHDAEFWAKEALDAQKKAQTLKHMADRGKAAMKAGMISTGIYEARGRKNKITLSPTKKRLVIDEAALPDEWKKKVTETVPDKERISQALEMGEIIPGASFEGGYALRFYKTKGSQDGNE